jgi:tetratricopeptide (TPR) repeat protein
MSDTELTAKIQGIEQSLTILNSAVTTLTTKVEGIDAEVKALNPKLVQLKELEDAKTETEIAVLTAKLEALKRTAPRKGFRLGVFLRKLPQHLLTYWTLVAFIIAAVVAVYVYKRYGVGYFETYENISNTKQSAKYYRLAGETLLSRAEFAAAEGSFKTATEIDPYNIEARRGLMLSQVLRSQEGHGADPPDIINARLQYLEAEPAFKDNPLLGYFRGRLAVLQGDRKKARTCFENSVTQLESANKAHPNGRNDFVGNYVELGILDMWDGKIPEAIQNFTKPVLANINQTTALNHLAECYLVSERFDDAFGVLSRLYSASPRLESYLVFGDFFRYRFASDPTKFKQDLESAKTMDRLAEDILNNSSSAGSDAAKKPDLTAGIDFGRMHFLPVPLANTPQFKDHSIAAAEKPEQYKALTNYALSLDHALAGDFTEANRYYSQATAADTFNEYRCRLVYMTRFYRARMSRLQPGLKAWFDEKVESLANRCNIPFGPSSQPK